MGNKKSQGGFTLVEAMITIAILTILVSLAVPSYFQYVLRTNRSEAIDGLLAASACQERLFIRNNVYDAASCGGATANGHYAVALATTNANQNFVATANPQGGQTKDSCGAMTLSDTGVKTAGGKTGTFAISCWKGKRPAGGS
jgi:type IV pilus assembly protein PilE